MNRTLRESVLDTAVGSSAAAWFLRRSGDRQTARIDSVRLLEPAGDEDIICTAVSRNEVIRLPAFLDHYRALGIDRFAIVDNGSDDGSLELLVDQPDVDVYASDRPFSTVRYGSGWITGLSRRYGINRWLVYADIDEHLVYDGFEDHSVHELARYLEAHGRSSLPTMMVDLYGDQPVNHADVGANAQFQDVYRLFDGTGYRLAGVQDNPRMLSYRGGPRERVLSAKDHPFRPELAKTPLVKWTSRTTQYHSHYVYPWSLNFGEPRGCMLHYKFLWDTRGRAEDAVRERNFYNQSSEQNRYLTALTEDPSLSFKYEESQRYEGSRSLVDAGLMNLIDWPD